MDAPPGVAEMREFPVDAMPGVDLKPEICRPDRRRLQPFQILLLDLFREGVGERAGVQLDDIGGEVLRHLDLVERRIDKETDANAGRVQPFHGGPQFTLVPAEIEATLGRDFLALLGDETNFIRLQEEREIDDLGRVADLEIELRHDVGPEPFQVAVLHVAAIGPQMRRDPARPRPLAKACRHERIGLGIFRVRHGGVARLPQGGDMIEINPETQSSHQASIGVHPGQRQTRR